MRTPAGLFFLGALAQATPPTADDLGLTNDHGEAKQLGGSMCTSSDTLVPRNTNRVASLHKTCLASTCSLRTTFPHGTATATWSVHSDDSWAATASTSVSVAGATSTTTSSVELNRGSGKATTTTTAADGGVVTTTTSLGSLSLNDHGGTASMTTSTASGGVVTTTTSTATWTIFNITERFFGGDATMTSTTASGGVVTTTTGTFGLQLFKMDSCWRGALTMSEASASGGASSTSTACVQVTLPGFMNPGQELRKLFVLNAAGWQNFVKLSGAALHALGLGQEEVQDACVSKDVTEDRSPGPIRI